MKSNNVIQITIKEHWKEEHPYDEWMKVADTGNDHDNGAIYDYVVSRRSSTEEKVLLQLTVDSQDFVLRDFLRAYFHFEQHAIEGEMRDG